MGERDTSSSGLVPLHYLLRKFWETWLPYEPHSYIPEATRLVTTLDRLQNSMEGTELAQGRRCWDNRMRVFGL